jgi:hypothetical protein
MNLPTVIQTKCQVESAQKARECRETTVTCITWTAKHMPDGFGCVRMPC